MSDDPDLLATLRAAVERDGGNVPLRLHFAELLQVANDHSGALEQFGAVLSLDPSNITALLGAGSAAEALGQTDRAYRYHKVAEALGASSTPTEPATDKVGADRREEVDEEFKAIVGESFGMERVRVGKVEEVDRADWMLEQPEITLADVGGLEDVKRRLHVSFLGPLRNPAVMKQYGKSLRGGLLLYGPPGCGKTFIARATAGELDSRFIAVGLSDVLDMWLGESERKLHEIFESARRNAPCVLFFDELDAIGQKRSQLRHHAGRNVVNQLLSELDGTQADNQGVFALGATNQLWDVDAALRRPGRFDRVLLVLPPDEPAREAILRFHLKDRPTDRVDVKGIARATDGFSGADLAHLCDSAVEVAIEESLETGKARSITGDDFKRALKEVRPSTNAWFEMARNHAMFANQSGQYDDLLAYIREKRI